jgi:hypothetical protein
VPSFSSPSVFKAFALLAFITSSLSGCGGGGGGDSASSGAGLATSLSSTALGEGVSLVISEVATNYFRNDVAWVEVFNRSSEPVNLSSYTLRSSHLRLDTGVNSLVPLEFALPSVLIPAGAYLVVAGKIHDKLQNSSQMVYVENSGRVPFWNTDGSLELVKGGDTADFVRFGTSMAPPLGANAWNGRNVDSLPSGANEHCKSIVRLASKGMADTNTGADWSLVNFATLAGVNDIAPGVVDSDLDGIPDSAKIAGGTYAGLDLHAMGARLGRRDIFVEIDYMKGSDPALTPRREALQKIVDAFAAKNIALHLDTGALHTPVFDPALFNLGGGNAVDFASCTGLPTSGVTKSGCVSLYDYKSTQFDARRNLIFHYALFANSLNADGSAGSSGVAELHGNDLIVSLGGYGFTASGTSSRNMLINYQASTLMHELGHNLGLRHGGNEDMNYKPNHYSIMNYMYQFAGLSTTPDTIHAAERYYLLNGLKGKTICNLVENSPCTESFSMNYSDGSSAPLNENALVESGNIGRGSVGGAYADWDNNNAFTGYVLGRNINPQDGDEKTVLKDYNEWGNLAVSFARTRSGSSFGKSATVTMAPVLRTNPMNRFTRQPIAEQPLPIEVRETLRQLREAHKK